MAWSWNIEKKTTALLIPGTSSHQRLALDYKPFLKDKEFSLRIVWLFGGGVRFTKKKKKIIYYLKSHSGYSYLK